MFALFRQLSIAIFGGVIAVGLMFGINNFERKPNIALAQTAATITSPEGMNAEGINATDADARKMINYQGQAFNPNTGQPYANTGMNFSFRIFNNAAGTSQVYRDDRFILTNADGFFSTNIGDSGNINNSYQIFNGQELYLRVYINDQELGPMQPITFVPYALWSAQADRLDDYDSDDFPKIIAYGVVNGDGSRASGHRFSSSRGDVAGSTVYILDINGINHSINDYTTIVTPACDAPVMTGIGTSSGDLLVDIWDPSGNRTTCRFTFMVMGR